MTSYETAQTFTFTSLFIFDEGEYVPFSKYTNLSAGSGEGCEASGSLWSEIYDGNCHPIVDNTPKVNKQCRSI